MLILSIWLSFSSCVSEVICLSCGIDNSPVSHVYEGIARIESYPWLGVLYYPYNGHKFTTAVVLVTRQIVLAAANEIDKLPKNNFRSLARVVIGQNCTGTSVGIRDYTYHPDYSKNTFSTLAMIQLEIDHATIELRPICPPPSHFKDESFFAMVLSYNCKRSKLRIHKMKYVSLEQCKTFYKRSDLGFGIYGPGCQAPARFLDYGMYQKWVHRSVERIGRPAITTLADNHVVMRRTKSNVQRFGLCDQEEMKHELYTEDTAVSKNYWGPSIMRRNVTIIAAIEYSCVVFKADYGEEAVVKTPKLKVRRWCDGPGPRGLCYGFGFLEIHFYVELFFQIKPVNLRITAYGKEAKFIYPSLVYKYLNGYKIAPKVLNYDETKKIVKPQIEDSNFPAYGKVKAGKDDSNSEPDSGPGPDSDPEPDSDPKGG